MLSMPPQVFEQSLFLFIYKKDDEEKRDPSKPPPSPRPRLLDSQEEAANRALANIVRQLASLGRHANEIFGEKKTFP